MTLVFILRYIFAQTCLKDAKFLDFFFALTRIRPNTTGRHVAFPFVSICGVELTYFRVSEQAWATPTPLIFTGLATTTKTTPTCTQSPIRHRLSLSYAGTRTIDFSPAALRRLPSGELVHPVPALTWNPWGLLGADVTRRLGETMWITESDETVLDFDGHSHTIPPMS